MQTSSIQKSMVVINSILLAFFIDIKCINQYLITFRFGLESIMSLMYISITLLIIVFGLFTKKDRKTKPSIFFVILLVYILSLYFITISANEKPFTSFAFFSVFTIVAFLIPLFLRVNPEICVKASMLLPVPAVLRVNQIFYQNMLNEKTISMGQSYAFLVPVIAAIIYLTLYFKEDNRIGKIVGIVGCSVNAVFLLQLLRYGSRGPVLSIALLVLFLFVVRFPMKDGHGISLVKSKVVLWTVSFVLLIILFSPVFFQAVLSEYDISLKFLDKSISLAESGDVSNGRFVIFSVVYNAFLEKPFFGHGFDLFHEAGLYYYPHNFLYQILYDGGLLMLFLVAVPTILKLIRLLRTQNRDGIILLTFLFFISVPGATFSGDLWQQGNLWLFIGVILNNNRMISLKLLINGKNDVQSYINIKGSSLV